MLSNYKHFVSGVSRDNSVGSFIEYTDGTKLFVADAQYRKKCNWYKAQEHCKSTKVSNISCSVPALYQKLDKDTTTWYHELFDIITVKYELDELDESPKKYDKNKFKIIYADGTIGIWGDITFFDMFEEDRHGCCDAFWAKSKRFYPTSKKASCLCIPTLRVGCELRVDTLSNVYGAMLGRYLNSTKERNLIYTNNLY